ncbi:hypothetical protein EVA_16821 [gut metagenome]|uniref:Uncharacterized protein n=1 Tax=gut metagenome TaxID=749906 RepID=J9FKY8_9ZZZZ
MASYTTPFTSYCCAMALRKAKKVKIRKIAFFLILCNSKF